MNLNKKRRQHYVPQSYLSAWQDLNNKVWCLRNRENIFPNATINIAQERDFYRTEELNKYEVALFKAFIAKDPIDVQRALLEHMNTHQIPIMDKKLNDSLEKLLQLNPLPEDTQKECENILEKNKQFIDKMQNDTEEDFYSDLEGEANEWLNELRTNKETFDLQKYYNELITFLCIQYFRTKRMRDSIIKSIESVISLPNWKEQTKIPNGAIRPSHLVHMFLWRFHNACATNLISKNAHITLLINNSDKNFLTSDQPIINLLADYTNLNKDTQELIFYYPISPKIAITLNDNNSLSEIEVSEDMIKEYNDKLVKASYEWVFGVSQSDIINYRL